MARNYFRPRERLPKLKLCGCGGQARLTKHRNFPHGRKSTSISYQAYVCIDCKKNTFINKTREVKRR